MPKWNKYRSLQKVSIFKNYSKNNKPIENTNEILIILKEIFCYNTALF